MKRTLIVDAAALVVYAAASVPALTGIPVHEWLGLGLAVVFVVHCGLHADWFLDAIRSFARRSTAARRANLVLDAALLLAFATVTVSGLGVSGTVLQAFGLYAEGYYVWAPLHAVAAKVLLALLLVHVAVHAASLYNMLKRRGPAKRAGHDDGGLDDGRRSA